MLMECIFTHLSVVGTLEGIMNKTDSSHKAYILVREANNKQSSKIYNKSVKD